MLGDYVVDEYEVEEQHMALEGDCAVVLNGSYAGDGCRGGPQRPLRALGRVAPSRRRLEDLAEALDPAVGRPLPGV